MRGHYEVCLASSDALQMRPHTPTVFLYVCLASSYPCVLSSALIHLNLKYSVFVFFGKKKKAADENESVAFQKENARRSLIKTSALLRRY
jgi:hypothetical protein